MRIGIIGSGVVGRTLGAGLAERGHEVLIGSRGPAKLDEWVSETGHGVASGTFGEVASRGELIFLATLWEGTKSALHLAGPDNLAGKVVVDVTNPLSFANGAPELAVGFDDSGAERIAGWLPGARVVKALNTVGAHIMVNPGLTGSQPTMFIAGDQAEAKRDVTGLIEQLGWQDVVDLGDLRMARYIEPLAMIWIIHYVRTQTRDHAFRLLRP